MINARGSMVPAVPPHTKVPKPRGCTALASQVRYFNFKEVELPCLGSDVPQLTCHHVHVRLEILVRDRILVRERTTVYATVVV